MTLYKLVIRFWKCRKGSKTKVLYDSVSKTRREYYRKNFKFNKYKFNQKGIEHHEEGGVGSFRVKGVRTEKVRDHPYDGTSFVCCGVESPRR